MSIKPLHYRTCIIRAWTEEGADPDGRVWRLIIETPSTGERKGFSTREEFMKALCQQLFGDDAENDIAHLGQ